jgi:DNA-3-methyladenine glycosylase II
MINPLTEETLPHAVQALTSSDPHLGRIVARYGPPPLWQREPGFGTLIHMILEQQVSLASARAAYEKLARAVQPLTPQGFLGLSDVELRAIGFSRQKTGYGRDLALALLEGRLDLESLPSLEDALVTEQLLKIKGIGHWTANIYLLMALGRPDIWPGGDLALAVAVQKLMGLESRPSDQELREMSLRWQPWRAVAARILWHFYLSERA